MMSARVIYILPSPLSPRDVERFGIDVLRKSGFFAEAWDISPVYFLRSTPQCASDPSKTMAKVFSTESDLLAAVEGLTVNDVVILLTAYEPHPSPEVKRLRRALAERQAFIGVATSALVANDSKAFLRRFTLRKRRGLGCKHLLRQIASAWLRVWWLPLWGTRRRLRAGYFSLDTTWVPTTTEGIDPLLVTKTTRIRPIHSFDYDKLLDAPNCSDLPQGGLVVIDTMGPFNPDYVMNDIHVPDLKGEDYYTALSAFLRQLTEVSMLPVAVAAHPRSPRGFIEPYLEGFSVHYGQSIPLIRDASACVVMGGSTMLGIIAYLRKPLVLVTSKSFGPIDRRLVRDYSKLLGVGVWDADAPLRSWSLPLVDREKMDAYARAVVKLPGTPEAKFWQVVSADLAMREGQSSR